MLAVNEFAKPSGTSIATIDAVLSSRSRLTPDPSEQPPSGQVLPPWSKRFLRPAGDPAGQAATLDLLLAGMAGAGHGVAALSFYLGLYAAEVRERAASLGLAEPAEKPLRRPSSANPWRVEDVRLLIALWLDNVSVASIAATLGRSPSSVHGKRRWVGLGVRDRKRFADRPVAECRATALPWKPTFDVSAIVARLMSPRPGKLSVIHVIDPPVQFPVEVKWALGRDKEKDERFSILGFAGLKAPAIAGRMLVEFGVREGVPDVRIDEGARSVGARQGFRIGDLHPIARVCRQGRVLAGSTMTWAAAETAVPVRAATAQAATHGKPARRHRPKTVRSGLSVVARQ